MTSQAGSGSFFRPGALVSTRPMARDLAFLCFGEISGTPKVTTVIDMAAYPVAYDEIYEGGSDENDPTRTFRVRIATAGRTGRLYGKFASAVNGTNANLISISCNASYTTELVDIGFGPSLLIVTIDDSDFGDETFSLKLTNGTGNPWRGNKGGEGLVHGYVGQFLRWTHEETAATSAIAINRRAPVLKITPPRATTIGAFHADGNDVTKSLPGFTHRFHLNQATIYHDCSPEILKSGIDNFRAVWLCKTLMVGDVGVGADLGPNSIAPTNASTSGAWGTVSTAIEFQIPRYHFRRNNNGQQPATPVDERPPLGSCITSIFIRRAPVRSGDYYVQNPATDSATVRLGHFKTATGFESHQTVTLAAGEVQKYVTLDQVVWPILSHDYLLYDSDSLMDVQAVICSPLDFVASNGEGSAAVVFPIMPWHYEDTANLLGV
jgi:hypothetical protein